MKKEEYVIIPWEQNGTSFSFDKEEDFRQKLAELNKTLKNHQKLQTIKRTIEEIDFH